MASKEASKKRGRNQSCEFCREKRRGCVPYDLAPPTCINCHKSGVECSISRSVSTSSSDAKRKITEIEGFQDGVLPVSASHKPRDPSVPVMKKSRPKRPAQPVRFSPPQSISRDACGICLKEHILAGERKGDQTMLRCDIDGCSRWYHLSCILFRSKRSQLFHSLATGTKSITFFCQECFSPKRKDLLNAVTQAESDFKLAIARIKQAITIEKEIFPDSLHPSPAQEPDGSCTLQNDTLSLGMDVAFATDFEPAKTDRYQGFQVNIIVSLLAKIEQAVYDYDREIVCANDLFLDRNETIKATPLKVWDQIDPGRNFVSGKEWFLVDNTANNLSGSHAPITAALRRLLTTPDDESLLICPSLENLSFSQVHQALINWFVFDILNNALNIYHFPNMKPLRATLAAVADFGEERWKGNRRQVLREVQLRAWHKPQFREEVIDKVGWQGDLIRRLEGFLAPMTKKLGRFNLLSESRANIIKHTIELWTYLGAAHGALEIIHPIIGEVIDERICEFENDNPLSYNSKSGSLKVGWILRRGFRFQEMCTDGRAMTTKARIIVN